MNNMMPKVPNGFHQALVSATVFLAGITGAYLKFVVMDEFAKDCSLLSGIGAVLAFVAILMQAETLRRALLFSNDDPVRFAGTAKLLTSSVWALLIAVFSLVLSHWWSPLSNWVLLCR